MLSFSLSSAGCINCFFSYFFVVVIILFFLFDRQNDDDNDDSNNDDNNGTDDEHELDVLPPHGLLELVGVLLEGIGVVSKVLC